MRDANAIRNLLLERLHLSLRSPGMCGGELGILNLMEYISFIDERESEWRAEREKLNRIGAFRSTGVHGGFWAATRQTKRNDSQPASVYALIAYEMGYLTETDIGPISNRLAFDELLDSLNDAFFKKQWTNHDLIEKFGQPSMRWGTNDNYPCILLYFDQSSPARFCYFDCWAEFYKDDAGCSVPKRYGNFPILRNIRTPASNFVDQFRFTDFGRSLMVDSADNNAIHAKPSLRGQ